MTTTEYIPTGTHGTYYGPTGSSPTGKPFTTTHDVKIVTGDEFLTVRFDDGGVGRVNFRNTNTPTVTR